MRTLVVGAGAIGGYFGGRLREANRDVTFLVRPRRAGELVAEELRLAQQALGEITGQVSSEELLGRIFASFCIGK